MGRHGTIANRKEKQDAKKAKIFTKYAKAIAVAASQGGSDVEYNATLKNIIDKAKSLNMPNDNIERAVKKGASNNEGDNFETITYEGYGPNGIAVIVETLTDNRNRTGANMRYYFDKNKGNLGTTGCVGYMFDKKGQIIIEAAPNVNEDELMEVALEAGAEDFLPDEEGYEIVTSPEDFSAVRDALSKKGYQFVSAEVTMIPQTATKLTTDEELKMMNRLIDMLEEDDDVQEVWHNWEME